MDKKQNNKLPVIKEDINKWEIPSTRKEQLIISRLRIGHNKLMHRHILAKTVQEKNA